MYNLKTIFTSNIPIDCYIKSRRLEREGIECFIFDENIVWVDPFSAVAVGGTKLKVKSNKFEEAATILKSLEKNTLFDNSGEYQLPDVFKNEIEFQNEILAVKSQIRKDPALLVHTENIKNNNLSNEILIVVIKEEKEFQRIKNLKLNFSINQFLYELFDPNRSVLNYFRVRPVEYYIEKEIVNSYERESKIQTKHHCPKCNSENISFGQAIDGKWDPVFLILSFLFTQPFPLFRKNFHCFECGNNFRKK